ncbi:MAG: MFS transporter [Anaerolineaceae bacterium]|nr:MFS transporter [Anaerolineaceae bacterium]
MNPPFIRDRFTWLSYFMLSYFAYIISALGPTVPFLRKELEFDYTVSAFYLSAFAAGMVIAGFTNAWMAKRFGRSTLFWGGGLLMSLGTVGLTLGRSAEVGIISTFLTGLLGSYLLVTVQSSLSEHHGNNRAFALTEANVFAVLAASAAPIAVGFGEGQGWTWRFAMYAGIAIWGLVFIWTRSRISVPNVHSGDATPASSTAKHSKLPNAFWAYAVVVFFAVAIEWCVIFWASTYMETVVGLSKEAAAGSVALFTVGQFIGRAAGSWLTRRYASGKLILIAAVIVLVGFPMFWLGRAPVVNAFGLFVCGLGVANLFPLTLSLTSAVGRNNPDAASGLTSMSSGIAILLTPQILGIVADRVGIQSAYGIVAPLGIVIIGVTLYANKLAHRQIANAPILSES